MTPGILLSAVTAFVVAVLLTRRFCDPASRLHLLDYPNERSLHSRPTPRTGGVAIVAGVVAGGVFFAAFSMLPIPRELGWLAGMAGLVAGVSYLDDRWHLPVGYRLTAHFVAALVLFGVARLALDTVPLPGLFWQLPVWLGSGLTVLFIVWMVNLYNFMDGMDGFAGGMAVFGFGCFAVMGWLAGHGLFALMNLVIVSASAGFLVFNFPPARIFMGDVGSSTLGFLAAAFSLWGARDGVFPFWIALLVFSPFTVDATVTLLRRLWWREKVWQAHKTHYYQKLVQAGWGHRKTVLVEYAIMLCCGITAVLIVTVPVGWQVAAFAVWMLFYFLFFSWVSLYAARHDKTKVL